MPPSLAVTLDFLSDLRMNNNREWFEANRPRYEAARNAHLDFVREVIGRFHVVDDLGDLQPESTVYRLHRDVRFAADKSPYKLNFGSYLGKQGRKTTGRGYYIQVEPGNGSFLGGGLYELPTPELNALREAIAKDAQPLRDIIAAADFQTYFGGIHGEQVKSAPKGYSKDHPAIDLLRYKQMLVIYPLTDEQMVSDGLIDHILPVFQAMRPFLEYLHKVVEPARQPMS